MPKYTFTCDKCTNEKQYYAQPDQGVKCTICGEVMRRNMPILAGKEVRETIDPHTNVQRQQDQDEIMRERKADYYWSVEVPRLVQTYSLETCLEQGWVWIDDAGKMHVHTKPPGKR